MPETEIILLRRTISRQAWSMIQNIPANSRVLVVNTYRELSLQLVATLYELGIYHLDLIPYDHNDKEYANIDYVITPEETSLVPPGMKNIIDIGRRPLDPSNIFEIINKLNIITIDIKQKILAQLKDIVPINQGFINIFRRFCDRKDSYDLLLEMVNYNVLIFDANNYITTCNKSATHFLKKRTHSLIHRNLAEIFIDRNEKCLCTEMQLTNQLVLMHSTLFTVNKQQIFKDGQPNGGIIIFRKCENDIIPNNNSTAALQKGHIAKYTFSDIRGNNPAFKKIIALAQKAANGNSDILLEGESGVGKELFAQAIHNSSLRHNQPFIAFNCAALSANLLESELFGYEGGAFTGATKAGKIGLFEAANNGTIFLDEISEIPLETQVKLLRVLQERELIRVGGTTIIPINVRIIAATNQDLYQAVSDKQFRMDLYFRLNVFNLKIPPLRSRKDDVPYLIKDFLHKNHINHDFPQKLLQKLLHYPWPGNVRELENCLSHMLNMSDSFSADCLPLHIQTWYINNNKSRNATIDNDMKEILSLLYEAYKQHQYIGRKEISQLLTKQSIFISEASVRTKLQLLAENGYVQINKGRAGTKITSSGINFMNSPTY